MKIADHEKFLSRMFSTEKEIISVEDKIKKNISNLLNVRCTKKLEDFLSIRQNNFDFRDYGLPEINNLNFEKTADIDKLCRVIKIAICVFEPRVSNFQITFLSFDKIKRNVHLTMQGQFTQMLAKINIVLKIGSWEFSLQ